MSEISGGGVIGETRDESHLITGADPADCRIMYNEDIDVDELFCMNKHVRSGFPEPGGDQGRWGDRKLC